MDNILKIENVVKRFDDYAAVNDVSFEVQPGRIFGLLGPNGAGKTTLIRMITNILIPDQGRITMFGEPVGAAFQNRIGYLPEERGLYKKIKVIEQLSYFGQLKGMSRPAALTEARKWLSRFDASDWENKKVQELSKGMAQKVQFISTILHRPDLLILDEPFSGFDPVNTEVLKSIILDLKEDGRTIILSTHIMEQAEQLCDDILLINKGIKLLEGNVREVKTSFGKDTIIIEFEGDDSFLNELHNVKFLNRTRNRAEFRLLNGLIKPRDVLSLALDKVDIYRFEISSPSLHEIFIDVVSKQESVA
jgi:ABC-2 type transport system ATP-binding protein